VFTKLLNAYCKYKKFDGLSAGIKWYGISLDPKQTPLHYGIPIIRIKDRIFRINELFEMYTLGAFFGLHQKCCTQHS
jgi:hypothetical protein